MRLDDTDRLLNRKEVEDRFGISKRFLEISTANGTGPRHVQIGRLVRYQIKDIRSWIEQNSSSEGDS